MKRRSAQRSGAAQTKVGIDALCVCYLGHEVLALVLCARADMFCTFLDAPQGTNEKIKAEISALHQALALKNKHLE